MISLPAVDTAGRERRPGRTLTDALAASGDEAERAFEAMITMKKIDIAALTLSGRM